MVSIVNGLMAFILTTLYASFEAEPDGISRYSLTFGFRRG